MAQIQSDDASQEGNETHSSIEPSCMETNTDTDSLDDEELQLIQLPEMTGEIDDESSAHNLQLINKISTDAGADGFVQEVMVYELMKTNCNWGSILSSAPKALASLGQCFVVASAPLSSSIKLQASDELKYDSVRENLVRCSDLGRAAFRDAESTMQGISLNAQYIYSNRGTISRILERAQDEELMDDDLDDQLTRLRQFSNKCVNDTTSVRGKFQVWLDQAMALNRACHGAQQKAESDETDIGSKSTTANIMLQRVNKNIEDTAEIAQQKQEDLKLARQEYIETKEQLAKKSTEEYLEDALSLAKQAGWLLPALGISSFNFAKSTFTRNVPPTVSRSASEDDLETAYRYALEIRAVIRAFDKPLCSDMDENSSRALSGHSHPLLSIMTIKAQLEHLYKKFPPIPPSTALVIAVQRNSAEIESIASSIHNHIKSQVEVHHRDFETLLERLRTASKTNDEILEQLGKMSAEITERRNKEKEEIDTASSKRARKLAQFNRAQEALHKQERRLRKLHEEEQRQKDEFYTMQAEIQKLASGQITMAEVKRVLSTLIKNLTNFKANLDKLLFFFRQINEQIISIDDKNVRIVTLDAEKMRKHSGTNQRMFATHAERLKFDALQLKGQYAVASEIAQTYVDISRRYIIPGVNQIDMMSIVAPKGGGSEAETNAKIK